MTLTKSDLSGIRTIVREETKPLEKKIDKVDKKFDKLFNFLDKDVSETKRRLDFIDSQLGTNTSEL